MSRSTPSPQNVPVIAQAFQSTGMNPTQVAGAIGNVKGESYFDPTAILNGDTTHASQTAESIGVDPYGSYGLMQWNSSRYDALIAYSNKVGDTSYLPSNGGNGTPSLATQAGFIASKEDGTATSTYNNYINDPNSSISPTAASDVFAKKVEGTDSGYDLRRSAAEQYSSTGAVQGGSGGLAIPPVLASQGYTKSEVASDGNTVYTKPDGSYVEVDPGTGNYYAYGKDVTLPDGTVSANPIVNGQPVYNPDGTATTNPNTNQPYTADEVSQLDANGNLGKVTQDSFTSPPSGSNGDTSSNPSTGGGGGGLGGAGAAAAGTSIPAAGCLGGAMGLSGLLAGTGIGQALGGLGQAAVMGAVQGVLSGGGIQGALSGALGGLGGAVGNALGASLGGAAGTLGSTLGGIAGQAIGGSLGMIAAGANPVQALSSSAFNAFMSTGANLIPGLSGVMPAGLAQAVVGGFAGVLGATAAGYPLSAAARFGLAGGLGGMIATVSNNMTGNLSLSVGIGAVATGALNGTLNLTGQRAVNGSIDLGRYATLIQIAAGTAAGNRVMVGAVSEAMALQFGNGVGGQGSATRNMQDAMTFSVTTLGQNVSAISTDMIAMGKWDATNMMRFMQPGNIIAQLLNFGIGDIIGLTDIMLANQVPVAGIDNPIYDRVSLAMLTAITDPAAISVVQTAFNMTTQIANLGEICLLQKMMPTSYKGMPVNNFREMGVHLAVMGVSQAATVYDIGVAFSQVETATDLNNISQLAQPLPAAIGASLLQTYGYGGGSLGEQTMADMIGTPAGYVHADTAPVIAASIKYIQNHSAASTLVTLITLLNNLASGQYTDLGTVADSTVSPPVPGDSPSITVPFPSGSQIFYTLDDAVLAFIPLIEAEQQKLLNTTDPILLDMINKLNLAWSASCAQLVRENNNLLMHQIDIFNLPPSTPMTGMAFAQSLDYLGTQTGYGQPADYVERVCTNDVYGDAIKYTMRQARNAQALANLGINVEKYKLPQSQYYREPENFYQALYTGNLPSTPQFQKTIVYPRTPTDTYIVNRDQTLMAMGYSEIPLLNNQKDEIYTDSLWMNTNPTTLENIGQSIVKNVVTNNIVVNFPDLLIKDNKGNPIKFGEIKPNGLLLTNNDIFVTTMLQLVNRALYGGIVTTKYNNPFNTDQMVYGVLELLAQVNGSNITGLTNTVTGGIAANLLDIIQQIFAQGAIGAIPGFNVNNFAPGQGSRSMFDTAMDRNDQTVFGNKGFGGSGPASIPK